MRFGIRTGRSAPLLPSPLPRPSLLPAPLVRRPRQSSCLLFPFPPRLFFPTSPFLSYLDFSFLPRLFFHHSTFLGRRSFSFPDVVFVGSSFPSRIAFSFPARLLFFAAAFLFCCTCPRYSVPGTLPVPARYLLHRNHILL